MITDAVIDVIIELRKKIGRRHIILVSDENLEIVELCDLSNQAVRCGCGTNCREKPVGKKHNQNGTFVYICRKHIFEQEYYTP